MYIFFTMLFYALTVVSAAHMSLPGTILFGCLSLWVTWFGVRYERGGNTYNRTTIDNSRHSYHTIYNPPLPTPPREVVERIVVVHVDGQYRRSEGEELAKLAPPPKELFRGDIVDVEAEPILVRGPRDSSKLLPPPKKQSFIAALVMGPKKPK